MTNMRTKPQEKWECLRCKHAAAMFPVGASARSSEDGSRLPSSITGRPSVRGSEQGGERGRVCLELSELYAELDVEVNATPLASR